MIKWVQVLLGLIILSYLIQIYLFSFRENTFQHGFNRFLQGLREAIFIVLPITTSIVFYIQIVEWYAMKYIIKNQDGRKIEEILFEHNHEPINEPIQK